MHVQKEVPLSSKATGRSEGTPCSSHLTPLTVSPTLCNDQLRSVMADAGKAEGLSMADCATQAPHGITLNRTVKDSVLVRVRGVE